MGKISKMLLNGGGGGGKLARGMHMDSRLMFVDKNPQGVVCSHPWAIYMYRTICSNISWVDPEGGTGGPDPPWNCRIINFCLVEIFRQTPSGNLDPPP